jgi:hypothetical protein
MRTGDQRTMLRLIVIAAFSMAMAAAAASTAEAKVFRGKTSAGRAASVVTGSDGRLRNARINWRAHCRYGRVADKTQFRRPHDSSTADAFTDAGTYRRRDGSYRLRFTTNISGTRVFDAAHPARERWRGTFRMKVLVTRRGHYVDTCRLGKLSWRARLSG